MEWSEHHLSVVEKVLLAKLEEEKGRFPCTAENSRVRNECYWCIN